MKVTETKTKTTMYDTNGNKISIVVKELLEVDTQTHLLNRTESKQVKEKVTIYKDKLSQAKKIKNQLEKTHGTRKGCKIFSSMADLIMVVENPVNLKHVPESISVTIRRTNHSTQNLTGSIWEQANEQYKGFQESLTKKRKR